MAASVRASSGAALDNPGDTLVVDKPTGTAEGDVLLFFTFWDHAGSGSISPPSGLTLQDSQTYATNGYGFFYTKVAGASEPSTYTFTNDDYSDDAGDVMIIAVQDADTGDIIDDLDTSTTGSGVHGNCPASTPTGSDSLLVCASGAQCMSSGSMGTSTPPSGMTLTGAAAQQSPTYGGYSFCDSAYEELSSSGSTGTKDFTFGRAKSSSRNWSVTINSAASGITGTGTFALQSLANAGTATGGDTTGTGTFALQPSGNAGSAAEVFTGTGTFALQPLANAGTATGGDTTGTGTFALQPSGNEGTAAEVFTGTGTFALQPLGNSSTATGGDTTGTGTFALQPLANAGTGAQTFTGTGTFALQPLANAAEGTVTGGAITGTGTFALQSLANASTGAQAFTGTGTFALQPLANAAEGSTWEDITGTGTFALQPLANAAEVFTGGDITATGTFALQPLGNSGAVTGDDVTGSIDMAQRIRDARAVLAENLDEIEGLTIRPYRQARNPKVGDGWITAGRVVPSTYRQSLIILTGIVVLGNDIVSAEELYDTLALVILDKVTMIQELPAADASVEPVTLAVDGGPSLNALTVSITTEVEQ